MVVSQARPFPFHSTDRFQYIGTRTDTISIGAVNGKPGLACGTQLIGWLDFSSKVCTKFDRVCINRSYKVSSSREEHVSLFMFRVLLLCMEVAKLTHDPTPRGDVRGSKGNALGVLFFPLWFISEHLCLRWLGIQSP